MGWLRLVGSFKLCVSFAKEPYNRDDILQKRPIITIDIDCIFDIDCISTLECGDIECWSDEKKTDFVDFFDCWSNVAYGGVYMHIHTRLDADADADTDTDTDTHARTYTHTRLHTHTHTHTHTSTHTRTPTHQHPHTETEKKWKTDTENERARTIGWEKAHNQ